jgi:hypothetical protein
MGLVESQDILKLGGFLVCKLSDTALDILIGGFLLTLCPLLKPYVSLPYPL